MKTQSIRFAVRQLSIVTLATVCLLAGCQSSDDVEVHVRSVGFDPANRSPVVLLEDRAGAVALPIWIGSAEAHAIALEFEGVDLPRPMTHDLLRQALVGAGVGLDKVVIESLQGDTYHARLYLRSHRRNFDLDARPSDAIALALRFDAPIFARAALLRAETTISLSAAAEPTQLTTVAGMTVQSLDPELASWFGIDPDRGGLVVTDVAPGLQGRVRRGDVLLGVDGAAVRDAEQLIERLARSGRRGATLHVRRGSRDLRIDLGPAG